MDAERSQQGGGAAAAVTGSFRIGSFRYRAREWTRAARERLASWRELHDRYARLLWGLYSAWALLSGIAVLVLAHNRYGFLRWVVLFLALTWGSMLVMYQETLFFLLPFYFYSTTF